MKVIDQLRRNYRPLLIAGCIAASLYISSEYYPQTPLWRVSSLSGLTALMLSYPSTVRNSIVGLGKTLIQILLWAKKTFSNPVNILNTPLIVWGFVHFYFGLMTAVGLMSMKQSRVDELEMGWSRWGVNSTGIGYLVFFIAYLYFCGYLVTSWVVPEYEDKEAPKLSWVIGAKIAYFYVYSIPFIGYALFVIHATTLGILWVWRKRIKLWQGFVTYFAKLMLALHARERLVCFVDAGVMTTVCKITLIQVLNLETSSYLMLSFMLGYIVGFFHLGVYKHYNLNSFFMLASVRY